MIFNPVPGSTRLAAYVRYSTDKQKETSLSDQLREINAEATSTFGHAVDEALVFQDKAVSGAGADRNGYASVMELVRAKPRRIDALLVHDVSRLGRDPSEALKTYDLLAFHGIRLICVADRIDTAQGAATIQFQFKAVYAGQFTEMVRELTLRGMKGRSKDGLSTGGLPHGYRSEPVHDAKGDVLHFRVVIDPEEAAVVVRIFGLYRDGLSTAAIATLLNRENIPTPRKGYKYRGTQWMDTSIRAMLGHERYVGKIIFGKTKWVKEPGTNVRRPQPRETPLMVTEHPEQRIVEQDVWDAVQARREAVHRKYTRSADGSPKGRSMPGNMTTYPFSGLLTCAVCGGPMVIIGGGPRRRYACSHSKQRGTCENRLTVMEDVTRERIVAQLGSRYTHPIAVAYVRKSLAMKLRDGFQDQAREVAERRARLARTDARIKSLVEYLADGHRSEAVSQNLIDMEAQARDEKRLVVELEGALKAPIRIPSDDEIRSRFLDLEQLVAREPMRARELLRRLFKGGTLRLHPEADGVYVARGDIFWLGLPLAHPETTKPSTDDSGRASIDRRTCGGVQPRGSKG